MVKKKICVITTNKHLTSLVKELIVEQKKNIQLIEGALDKAMQMAVELENQGVEVFVTTAGNAVYLREQTEIPVVSIPANAFDHLYTLHQVIKYPPEIVAVFHYRSKHTSMDQIEEVLGYKPLHFIFNNEIEARKHLDTAQKKGIKVIVGGGFICELASSLSFITQPVEISKEALLHAINEAEAVATVRRKERGEAMKFKAVLDLCSEAIIATNKENRITVINPMAEKLSKTSAQHAVGQPVSEIFPGLNFDTVLNSKIPNFGEIETINRAKVISNKVPIIFDNLEVVGVVANFQEISRIQKMEAYIRKEVYTQKKEAKFNFSDIVGKSKEMQQAIYFAKTYGKTDETTLITGESGCGKELFAGSIHNMSQRRFGPFMAVNCAAIPANLLESELFGYKEGAFTGATKGGKPGLFELAHGGTLFLDEVGEIPIHLQAKLLRALQEKEVMRVGGNEITPVNVRIIAATNKDLLHGIINGDFRKDLYYRLNVLHLKIPTLKERLEDIPDLCNYILNKIAPYLVDELKSLIISNISKYNHEWPGNVRELENLMRRMVAVLQNTPIFASRAIIKEILELHIGETSKIDQVNSGIKSVITIPVEGELQDIMTDVEKQIYKKFLQKSNGSKSDLAQKLGIGRTTLWRKLNKLGL